MEKRCYFIPDRLFLIHKMIPRRTSTSNTDDTEATMMEVSEVSVIGVLAIVLSLTCIFEHATNLTL